MYIFFSQTNFFQVPAGDKIFEGECIPDWKSFEDIKNLDEDKYPHTWRGAVICFVFGLLLMVITDLFALLTICCRRCICCSVFTVCGSMQSCATILFALGLVAYPAGWGSKIVNEVRLRTTNYAFIEPYDLWNMTWFIKGIKMKKKKKKKDILSWKSVDVFFPCPYSPDRFLISVTSKYIGSCWSYRKTKVTLLCPSTIPLLLNHISAL